MSVHHMTHGRRQRGGPADPTYTAWTAMRRRCNSVNTADYPYYGGRGIKVCAEWNSFDAFLADMGERPAGKTLDRRDANGDYCKSNCRWATRKEQANNTRRNHYIEFNGEIKTLQTWADERGMQNDTLRFRLRDGWSVERALTTPVRQLRRKQ